MNSRGEPWLTEGTAQSTGVAAEAKSRRWFSSVFHPKAWRITLVYAVLSLSWIYFSDRALGIMVDDPALLMSLSVYKGWAFVSLTSALILLLMSRAFAGIEERNRSLADTSRQLRVSEERLGNLIHSAMDAIVTVDGKDRIMMFNRAAETMFGYHGNEVRCQPLSTLIPQPFVRSESGRTVIQGRRKDGEVFQAEAAASHIHDGTDALQTLIFRDVSDRLAHELEIEHLNGLYTARGRINLAIVRIPSRDELFQEVCRILTDTGGFEMVWIGWHDEEARRLRPIAVWGDENGYLEMIEFRTGDHPEPSGPSARVFRENRAYICNDLMADPVLTPWNGESGRRGFRSAAYFPIRHQDGVAGVLNVYAAAPGFFQDQEITLLKGTAEDLAFALTNLAREEERRRVEQALRKSEQQHRVTLDTILEACQIIDFDWRVVYLNDAAARQSRRPNRELLGKTMLEIWPGFEGTDVYELIRRCLENRETSHQEIEFAFSDGDTGWFDVRVQPVPEGAFLLSIDITERRRAEWELRELNRNLENEVTARTTELATALVRAEESDRLKSAFLATMSHELRTPLNSIIGFTGIVLQGLAGELNAEQAKQLGMVRSSARHLLELINDVLDLSKIEADQLEVRAEPFDLRASIERVADMVRPLAEKKNLALEVNFADETGELVADQRRVEQILLNLLNNGVKFTSRGGITVTTGIVPAHRTTPDSTPATFASIRVTDTGAGIAQKDMQTLFQPFQQIDTGLSRQHEGTGLGLAICRRLAGLMGGEIQVTSKPGAGSTFTLLLPLQPDP